MIDVLNPCGAAGHQDLDSMGSTPPPADWDRLPPHSPEAEQSVLGCILLSADECMPQALARLTRLECFYDLRHQTVFRCMVQMHGASQPIDVITVYQRLKDRRELEQAGGVGFLSTLPDMVPSAANLGSYLHIVQEKFQLRQVLRLCSETAGQVYDSEPGADKLLEKLSAELHSLQNGQGSLPPILDAYAFVTEDLQIPQELIQECFHQGSKLVLGGGSKTFKTWTLLDLGVSVAAGEPWLGFKTTKARVLFVNFEIQHAFFQKRLEAVLEAKAVHLSLGQLDIWNLRGHGQSYELIIPRIMEQAQNRYGLIILDPVYKLYGQTDENSARDVGRLLNSLETLTTKTGAAVAFGAHYSKGNQASKETIDRISGSGVFARDPDSIVNFTRHEEPDAFTVEMTLRNFRQIAPFVVRWDYPLFRRSDDLDPKRLKQAIGRPKRHTVEKILKLLENNSLTTSDWQKKAKSEYDIPKTSFYELLEKVRSGHHKVKQTTEGVWVYEKGE